MAKNFILGRPPEHSEVDSWSFKRWISNLYDYIITCTKVVTVTTTYTVAADVFYVRADATAGIFTVTLPTALNNQGRPVLVKKIDSSVNAVTVSGTGSDTIEGGTVSLATQWSRTHLISNGNAAWEIM